MTISILTKTFGSYKRCYIRMNLPMNIYFLYYQSKETRRIAVHKFTSWSYGWSAGSAPRRNYLRRYQTVNTYSLNVNKFVQYFINISDDSLDFITVTIHIFNFILMMIDFIVVAHPFRFLHIFWSMLMAAVYELFSWVYFMAGGTGR